MSVYRPLNDEERKAFIACARDGRGPSIQDLKRWAEGYLACEEQRDVLWAAAEDVETLAIRAVRKARSQGGAS